jgi:hypothetical protein
VARDEGLKIKSCKWVSGNKGRDGRVLVCSTFSRHLSDGFHLDASQEAAAPSRGLRNACPNHAVSPSRYVFSASVV